jgi:hypothetical protein
MFLGEDKQAAGMLLGALRWSDEITSGAEQGSSIAREM